MADYFGTLGERRRMGIENDFDWDNPEHFEAMLTDRELEIERCIERAEQTMHVEPPYEEGFTGHNVPAVDRRNRRKRERFVLEPLAAPPIPTQRKRPNCPICDSPRTALQHAHVVGPPLQDDDVPF